MGNTCLKELDESKTGLISKKELKIRTNIILDLDGTLITNKNDLIFPRPYLKEFFNYIFKNFDNVSIFTAANDNWFQYVYSECLIHYLPKNCKFKHVWTCTSCLTILDFDLKYKRVKKLSNIFIENSEYNKNNTFFIDDSLIHKKNNHHCFIGIKKFCIISDCYTSNNNQNDTELLKIINNFEIYGKSNHIKYYQLI